MSSANPTQIKYQFQIKPPTVINSSGSQHNKTENPEQTKI